MLILTRHVKDTVCAELLVTLLCHSRQRFTNSEVEFLRRELHSLKNKIGLQCFQCFDAIGWIVKGEHVACKFTRFDLFMQEDRIFGLTLRKKVREHTVSNC